MTRTGRTNCIWVCVCVRVNRQIASSHRSRSVDSATQLLVFPLRSAKDEETHYLLLSGGIKLQIGDITKPDWQRDIKAHILNSKQWTRPCPNKPVLTHSRSKCCFRSTRTHVFNVCWVRECAREPWKLQNGCRKLMGFISCGGRCVLFCQKQPV